MKKDSVQPISTCHFRENSARFLYVPDWALPKNCTIPVYLVFTAGVGGTKEVGTVLQSMLAIAPNTDIDFYMTYILLGIFGAIIIGGVTTKQVVKRRRKTPA